MKIVNYFFLAGLLAYLPNQMRIMAAAQNENTPTNHTSTLQIQQVFKNQQVTIYVKKSIENNKTQIIAYHKNGTITSIPKNKFIAYHEAAHAVTFMQQPSLKIIENINIIDNSKTAGTTKINSAYDLQKNIEELELTCIGFLAGGIANQLMLNIQPFATVQDIDRYFSNAAYENDWVNAYQTLVKITQLKNYDSAISSIILQETTLELYYKTYQFVLDNQSQIHKLAQLLLRHKSLSKEQIYHILNKDLPLYHNEQGPLPIGLHHHYEYRYRNADFIN